MTTSIELKLLKCPQCSTPVPAEEDEVAWVCATCGTGLQLTDDGLAPLAVHWAVARPGARADNGRPFWVFPGAVRFQQRVSYSGHMEPETLWGTNPLRFFVPAYNCPLEKLQSLGADLTRRQPALQAGPAGQVAGVNFLPDDARRVAQFVVLTIEAARPDKLRSIQFDVNLGAPELWMLPFAGEQPLV